MHNHLWLLVKEGQNGTHEKFSGWKSYKMSPDLLPFPHASSPSVALPQGPVARIRASFQHVGWSRPEQAIAMPWVPPYILLTNKLMLLLMAESHSSTQHTLQILWNWNHYSSLLFLSCFPKDWTFLVSSVLAGHQVLPPPWREFSQ